MLLALDIYEKKKKSVHFHYAENLYECFIYDHSVVRIIMTDTTTATSTTTATAYYYYSY